MPATSTTHRSRALLIGALGLAVLAGVLLGRATANPPQATAPDTRSPAPDDPEPDQREPVGPGPVDRQAGMPVGFASSKDGAVAAATGYTVALDGPLLFDGLDDALEVAATDDARADLADQFGQVAELLDERLNLDDQAEVISRPAPAGYRIDNFEAGEAATVSVWGTGLLVAGETRVPPGWRTTTVELEWAADDWKLAGLSSSDGPSLDRDDGAGATAQATSEIAEFDRYQHTPAEVG